MKRVFLFVIITVCTFCLVGCNQDLIDTNYTYTKAITTIGNESLEVIGNIYDNPDLLGG